MSSTTSFRFRFLFSPLVKDAGLYGARAKTPRCGGACVVLRRLYNSLQLYSQIVDEVTVLAGGWGGGAGGGYRRFHQCWGAGTSIAVCSMVWGSKLIVTVHRLGTPASTNRPSTGSQGGRMFRHRSPNNDPSNNPQSMSGRPAPPNPVVSYGASICFSARCCVH